MKTITAIIKGKWINHPHYSIPAIVYKKGLLFTVYDDKYLKFILVDYSYNIIELKYSPKKKIIHDSELIKYEFEHGKNIDINKGYYEICNFQEFESFPPTNCLENKVIFTIWFGNSFSANRNKQLKSLIKTSKCNVININENNIHLLKYPIHKSFIYMSSIHKSDYLRCYLMYHYGGGYSDIKSTSDSWIKCFDDLQRDTNLYAIGYNCDGIPSKCDAGENYDIELHNNLMLNIKNLIGVGFFIFKKNTSLVNEWWLELNNRLDFFNDELKKNPAKYDRESKCGAPIPRWEGGKLNTNYPIYWNYILGHILYPIYLKHIGHIKKSIPHRNDHGNYQ